MRRAKGPSPRPSPARERAPRGGPTGERWGDGTDLGFDGDDIDAACEAVECAGGAIVSAPVERKDEDIKIATVADPDGNTFMFSQSI